MTFMHPPRLLFFCELDTVALQTLFDQPTLIPMLAQHGWGVALGLGDWSDERAAVVQQLSAANVPVVGWLLLSAEEGYWFNLQNYPHALAAYIEFQTWVALHDLQFTGVGLDIAPGLSERQAIQRRGLREWVSRWWAARRNALFPAAQSAYSDLVANMRHDGYVVYGYQLPLLVDDRRAGTNVLQRVFDIVDLPVDEEVIVCYSSHLPRLLFGGDLEGAFVRSYGVHADGIAVGVTGGGHDANLLTGAPTTPLEWPALRRDLLLAAQWTPTIHVFSLEGCVERGWLPLLAALDWNAPVTIPITQRLTITTWRGLLAAALWWSRFGVTLLGWLGWLAAAWLFLKPRAPLWLQRWRRRG